MALAEVAQHADAMAAQARVELVAAVRRAAAEGLTQAEIGRQIGRSQPEVSRLLRFHGTSELARRLRKHSREIQRLVSIVGGDQVRVFGSVAEGREGPSSDVDLVFRMRQPLSLLELGLVERQIADLIGVDVDLVPESSLRPDLRTSVLAEAVPL